ncbi:MAG: CBS domain-containing protein [Lachnospiraceae bacterium]|nr:CBS domain-containing protein [Lachnospiraceae bacterium]
MNILFFLKPKSETEYIYTDESLRQVLEKMEYHRFSAVPMIDRETGEYVGTITEGDLLIEIKNRFDLSLKDAEDIKITDIPRRRDNKPVDADANMEDLFQTVMNQNFVPVIDDKRHYIGIITRKDVIGYLISKP